MALQNKGGVFFVIREGGKLCNLKNLMKFSAILNQRGFFVIREEGGMLCNLKFSAILAAVEAADFLFANRDGLDKFKESAQFMGTRDENFPQKIISHADL